MFLFEVLGSRFYVFCLSLGVQCDAQWIHDCDDDSDSLQHSHMAVVFENVKFYTNGSAPRLKSKNELRHVFVQSPRQTTICPPSFSEFKTPWTRRMAVVRIVFRDRTWPLGFVFEKRWVCAPWLCVGSKKTTQTLMALFEIDRSSLHLLSSFFSGNSN
jgi:hypothetical protein